jgi:ribosomal protein S18 acetylase RimI-like enzyme
VVPIFRVSLPNSRQASALDQYRAREQEMKAKMPDLPYTIRQATPSDSAPINELCVEAYREFEPMIGSANWESLRHKLSQASELSAAGELILAESGGKLLGVILYVPPGRSDGKSIPGEWASIRMLAVSPLCRGRGVGRTLTQECIDRARRDDAAAIGLTTADMMRIAQPMYERMGFQKEAELGERFGVTEARYVMRLR